MKSNERLPWDLDWNLLRTFMTIVEQGGITSAADHLGRKQPTISNALRRLEERFEHKLIDRKPNYFRVTTAGELLYQECVQVFGTVSRIPELIKDADDEITGHISIAVASHVVSPLLDEVLGRFYLKNPKVSFSINVSESHDVVNSVIHKKSSFGMCLAGKKDKRLTYKIMYRQFFGYFCGPNHKYFGAKNLTIQDLEEESMVSFQTDHEKGALQAVAQMRTKAGLNSQFAGISSSLTEVRRMIVAGIGIGPLPLHIAQSDVEKGNLWQLPPYDDLPPIDIYFIANPKAHLNRAEKGLINLLNSEISCNPIASRTYI